MQYPVFLSYVHLIIKKAFVRVWGWQWLFSFCQLGSNATTDFGVAGIRFIAREITLAHEGTISGESDEPSGMTFNANG